MKNKMRETRLAGVPAWALSLITLAVFFILFMLVDDPKSASLGTAGIIAWIIYNILLFLACYLICWLHPKSVWYTPFICNAMGVLGIISIIYGNLVIGSLGVTTLEWLFILGSVALSIAGAILGAMAGRRIITR